MATSVEISKWWVYISVCNIYIHNCGSWYASKGIWYEATILYNGCIRNLTEQNTQK